MTAEIARKSFDDDHIDDTCAALEAASAQQRDDDCHLIAARRTLKAFDRAKREKGWGDVPAPFSAC